MPSIITRRAALAGSALAGAAFLSRRSLAATAPSQEIGARLAALEAEHACRLGVAILDTAGTAVVGHRLDERFALCSTFKALAASFVLSRVDEGRETLGRRVVFEARDLVDYSPKTEQHVGAPGLTMAELCEAAITLSDNTAGNLLLDSFGGPEALTLFLRSTGDAVTRLDRREPALNEAAVGDPRDTTTPAAMIGHLRAFLLGDALQPASRAQLMQWLLANTTGAKRLKAGIPADWTIGDKTGTSSSGIAADVGILTPPNRPPILVSVYIAEATRPVDEQSAAIAEVGRIVASMA